MLYYLNLSIKNRFLSLSRLTKKTLAITLDILICIYASWVSIIIDYEKFIFLDIKFIYSSLISILILIPLFLFFELYKSIFRFNGEDFIKILAKAIIIYSIIYFFIVLTLNLEKMSLSIILMQPILVFLLIGTTRWLVKNWLGTYNSNKSDLNNKKNIAIYGAGRAGQQLASSLRLGNEFNFVSYIDDHKNFWGTTINGKPVNSPSSIDNLIHNNSIDEIWLAMPKANVSQRQKIIDNLGKFPVYVRTLPNFSDLASGKFRLSDLRDLNINDLLGRHQIKPNQSLLKKCIFQKIVMVTGAGGSIGSELCRQVLHLKPKCILLIENSELALYNIHNELETISKSKRKKQSLLIPILADIKDENLLTFIFKSWRPDTVYHAAAFKHVPIVEDNLIAGISNNVLGTINCAKIAIKFGVKNFVLVSTDKAVRPTNVMGASKRLAEMILQSLACECNKSESHLSIVRFGNVLGSSGSVVPLFRKQIEAGGPVTLTHKDISRYFMTISEAAQLVIQAGGMSEGGEVFILEMGEPVYIRDLAKKMIELSGLRIKDEETPEGDIEIKIVGIRDGEKLYEELLTDGIAQSTIHPKILKANEVFPKKESIDNMIKKLIIFTKQNNIEEIRKLLIENVNGYFPNGKINNYGYRK